VFAFTGYKNPISAADVAHAVTALLECANLSDAMRAKAQANKASAAGGVGGGNGTAGGAGAGAGAGATAGAGAGAAASASADKKDVPTYSWATNFTAAYEALGWFVTTQPVLCVDTLSTLSRSPLRTVEPYTPMCVCGVQE